MAELSLAQQIDALWADARQGEQRVYAVLLGDKLPGLRAKLAAADVDDWDGLWTGELEPGEADAAPHLVGLTRGSAFAEWLHADAAKAYGDWGLFVKTRKAFMPLRTHGRALCRAGAPDGRELRLAWADRATLLALLPLAPRAQLDAVFGGIEQIVFAGTREWLRIAAPLGRLAVERSGVLGAA